MLNILSWNIQHRTGANLKKLIPIIIEKNSDIVVLSEYRGSQRKILKETLLNGGYRYQIESSIPNDKTNGIFIASKHKFMLSDTDYKVPEPDFRWLDINLVDYDLRIVGIHIPCYTDFEPKITKKSFWEDTVNFAKKFKNDKVLLIGDFNTGLHEDAEGAPFKCFEYMISLKTLGWIDTWRDLNPDKSEYTWYHNRSNNGFRIDYAFVSPSLKNMVSNVKYNHEDRVMNYSDHSSLSIELDIKKKGHSKLNEFDAFDLIFKDDEKKKHMAFTVYNLIKSNLPKELHHKYKFRYLNKQYSSNIAANLWNNKIFQINNYPRKAESITLIYPNNMLNNLMDILEMDLKDARISYYFKFDCCLIELTPSQIFKLEDTHWNAVKEAVNSAYEFAHREHVSNINVLW